MFDQSTLEGKVITAALDLAASPGWTEVSLRDIADAAGTPLSEVVAAFPDKSAIVAGFFSAVDRDMLQRAGEIERDQTARDALFEVIMTRFDAMAPHKAGLKSILSPAGRTALLVSPRPMRVLMATPNKVLQAAGINGEGGAGLARQFGLTRVLDQVFRIWLVDDDPGMARTMAALDRRLRQGERGLRLVDDLARSGERTCERLATIKRRFCDAAFNRAGRSSDAAAAEPTSSPPTQGDTGGAAPDAGAAPAT